MEQHSSRLYSGPLSRAAQKVLAVLRAQNLHAVNPNSSCNRRQIVERYYGSQREPLTQSSWSMSQEESRVRHRKTESNPLFRPPSSPQLSSSTSSTSRRDSSSQWQSSQTSALYQSWQTPDFFMSYQASSCPSSLWDSSLQASQTEAHYRNSQIYSQGKRSKPPAYQSGPALPFSQHEVTETAASSCHRDILSPQIPESLFEHQTAPQRHSTGEIRPSFIQTLCVDGEVPDGVLFPTMECHNTHQAEPSMASHPVSTCLEISEATDNTSGAQREKKMTVSWNIPLNKAEAGSESQAKRKRPLSDPTVEACRRREDFSSAYQQLQLRRNVDMEELMVDSENNIYEMQDGDKWQERGRKEATLQIEKGPANEMGGIRLNSASKNRGFISSDKVFDCDAEDKVGEKESDFESSVHEIKDTKHPPGVENKQIEGCPTDRPVKISVLCEREDRLVSFCRAEKPEDVEETVTEPAEESHTERPLLEGETIKLVPGDGAADNLEGSGEGGVDVMEVRLEVETQSGTKAGLGTGGEDKTETEQRNRSDGQLKERRCEADNGGASELPGGEAEPRERGGGESGMPPAESNERASTEEPSRSTATFSRVCGVKRSWFRSPCLRGDHRHHDNVQAANGNIRGSSSSVAPAPASTFAAGQNSSSSSVQVLVSTALKAGKEMENIHLPASMTHSHLPSFPLKMGHERPQHQNTHPCPKTNFAGCPPKWRPPCSSQEKGREGRVNELKTARPKTSVPEPHESQTEDSPSHKSGMASYTPKQAPQIGQRKVKERSCDSAANPSRQTSSSVTRKAPRCKRPKSGPDQETTEPKITHEGAIGGEPQNQSKAGSLTATLTSDPRVKDSGKLNPDERMRMLEEAREAEVLVLTLVKQDGTTQLDPEQKLTPPVCGLLVLMKNSVDCGMPEEDSLGPHDSLVYLKLEHTPAWARQHTHRSQELFAREMLLQVLSRSQLVVCFKAKDLLRTALQLFRQDLSWKKVAGCRIQDPQVSGWLLDPANPSSCFQDLLSRHCRRLRTAPALGGKTVSQILTALCSLYRLNMELCTKLQSFGLWELYVHMEVNMISVLAAMESHRIHVDKEALRRTSDLLGTKMKQLEQEAHRAAGQIFLITSNAQLRTVLFEKLCLHQRCDNKKLPKTINKQQQSTSEAALLQLQDLHPLPKIILEYRQVHKIKSTFVDGILSCMRSKDYISSTWHQTSVVTGRISAKHPNFQALPRQPLQITKKLCIQGEEEEEEETVSVHPRAMFVPQEGWTFVSADFCQVELRLLAHLSSDPELLRIFTHPQADVFTMLASQWKGVSEGQVTCEDREHAKRIVYSVVYGAGRERLSGILGVSAEQASRFQDSFLQTYREVQAFIHRTVQQCHKQGYVLSIMGRRRTLPNISSPDWAVRMQAERQAVNFVVQGSAADLCKMAMIRIFNLVASSSSLSARLVAQLHDELLYEVEDSQVEQFAALVRSTMESLQHVDHLRLHLKVPLKVAVSSGKSWGSMSELNIPPTSPL